MTCGLENIVIDKRTDKALSGIRFTEGKKIYFGGDFTVFQPQLYELEFDDGASITISYLLSVSDINGVFYEIRYSLPDDIKGEFSIGQSWRYYSTRDETGRLPTPNTLELEGDQNHFNQLLPYLMSATSLPMEINQEVTQLGIIAGDLAHLLTEQDRGAIEVGRFGNPLRWQAFTTLTNPPEGINQIRLYEERQELEVNYTPNSSWMTDHKPKLKSNPRLYVFYFDDGRTLEISTTGIVSGPAPKEHWIKRTFFQRIDVAFLDGSKASDAVSVERSLTYFAAFENVRHTPCTVPSEDCDSYLSLAVTGQVSTEMRNYLDRLSQLDLRTVNAFNHLTTIERRQTNPISISKPVFNRDSITPFTGIEPSFNVSVSYRP